MDTNNRIVINPGICHGKPIIRGTTPCQSRWWWAASPEA